MSELFIIATSLLIIWLLIQATYFKISSPKENTFINISLLISLFILTDKIASITFLILVLRLIAWLFGPCQERMDYHYYTRYRKAKRKYKGGTNNGMGNFRN